MSKSRVVVVVVSSHAFQWRVVVVSSIMYYEFVISKEEGVAFDLPGRLLYLDALLVRQLRQVVDELPGVGAAGDHEAELEVVRADHLPPEVVPLHHLHLVDGLRAIRKVQRQSHGPQQQEVRPQVVLDDPSRGVVVVAERAALSIVHLVVLDLHEGVAGDDVSDLEPAEPQLGPVVAQTAQEFLGRLLKTLH